MITNIWHPESRDILFSCMVSDNHFFRIFGQATDISACISYLLSLKENIWKHWQLDELAIDSYISIIREKVLSPQTLERFVSNSYDIELLVECFPEIKTPIDNIISLKPNFLPKPIINPNQLFYAPLHDKEKLKERRDYNFLLSVANNDYTAIKENLRFFEVLYRGNCIDTAVQTACYRGYFELTKLLLEYGAQITCKNECGLTLLHLACTNKPILEYLLGKNCIDINAETKEDINGLRRTPLDLAILWHNQETMDLLKEHGAVTWKQCEYVCK